MVPVALADELLRRHLLPVAKTRRRKASLLPRIARYPMDYRPDIFARPRALRTATRRGTGLAVCVEAQARGTSMIVQEPEKVVRARRRIRGGADGAQLSRVKDVLCEPARLRIVEALGGDELSVGDLAAAIGRKVPATSQHLRVLRELGIVERQRRARAVYYRLRPGATSEQVLRVLRDLRGRDDAQA